MDQGRAGAWLAAYRRAWEEADTPAVVGLFTGDATYRSHPLRPVHAGSDGIAAYWTRAAGSQRDVRVRLGHPIVDGDRAAVEWWATMTADGDPATLVGCLLLSFAPDGPCRRLRECWHEAEALLDPPADWGRLGPPPDQGAAAGRNPHGGPGPTDPASATQGREHARRWAEGYERAWRAADPEAAAALYAPDAHFRSAPFRDPDLGRDGVLAYTRGAYATEADQDPRFGAPVAAGPAAAVEWWATLLEEGQPATIIGTSFLTFTPDGLVATARDYWFLEPGTHHPFDDWGR